MQARRIVMVLGAVALVAVGLVAVRLRALQPVAPVGDVAPTAGHLPAAQDQSVLARVGVGPHDLGPGLTAELLDQGDELSQPTLDLCWLHFASEARRQARRQVAVSGSSGDPILSTEAVLYGDQAGAAEAMGEARGAASRCPSSLVPSPDPAVPPLRWQIHDHGGLGDPPPAGIDRQGLSVTTSAPDVPSQRETIVLLRRGRLLLGLYFLVPDGPQAQVDGGDTIASTVKVFEQRMAALPAADVS
jgi:hypothetical protein